jgi:hypothetical protein
MFTPKYLSVEFRIMSLLWTAGLVSIMSHYTLRRGVEVIMWQVLMIVNTGFLVVTVFMQVVLPFCCSRTNPVLTYIRLATLVISGPLLFCLAAYAFFEEIDLNIEEYYLIYASWTLLFYLSMYNSFELTLDLSQYLEKLKRKEKLANHLKEQSLKH